MNTISNVLFWISNGLLVPVAVLLILFLIQALILAGGFFGEYFRRRTVEKKVSSLLDGGAAELEKAMASLPQDGKSPSCWVSTPPPKSCCAMNSKRSAPRSTWLQPTVRKAFTVW